MNVKRTALLGFAWALLSVPASFGQDKGTHAADPRKCRICLPAYEQALVYLKKNLGKMSFSAKMVAGWVFLADGRFPKETDQIVREAMQWERKKGSSQHAQNWYPALAGIFLAEHYKWYPSTDVRDELARIVKWFQEKQERTGGWFKWFEGAYKDRLDYAVKDLGMLTSIVYGFLWTVKTLKIPVDETTLKRADDCLLNILTDRGIGYGSVSRTADITGARGGFALLGLDYAGLPQHKICKTYVKLLPQQIANLDKGHHIGAFHGLGVALACNRMGPETYARLTAQWLDKLIAKQTEAGGVYIGDDGDAGGEKGLIGGDFGSTGAFALMILLQDAKVLKKIKK